MDSKHWQDVEKDWKFYFEEGKSYLGTSNRLIKNKGPFNNEFIYHLAVLGGERLMLGLLLSYDQVPATSSLSGMLQDCKEFLTVEETLLEGAEYLTGFQNFCSLDVKTLTVPKDEELKKIVDYIQTIEAFCEGNLNKKAMRA